MAATTLDRDLRRLISAAQVSTAPDVREEHAGDKWFASHLPDVVVLAKSASDVSTVLRYASQHDIPVTPRGAGYGYVGGCVPAKGGIALSVAPMRKIVEINKRDFVAVAQPGVITGDLISRAAKLGLLYPPDPASLANSSIGGNIATNAGGPRCLKYGVTKNYVLGLEVVLMDGTTVRTGGRTQKNKTGFDLTSLFVGSEGMLGVVTEATLKLLPLPPERGALSAVFPTLRQAALAVEAIVGNGFLPAAIEIADVFTLRAARARLGDAILPEGDSHLLVEVDGHRDSVRSELKLLAALLSKNGATSVQRALGATQTNELWRIRREFSESLKATGLTKLNEDVVVPRGRLVDLMRFADQLQRKYKTPVACFGHAGDGNIHVNIMVKNYSEARVKKRMDAALDELFTQVIAWNGSITGEHGIGLAKKRWWSQATSSELRKLHAAIKRAVDPSNLLNPGKFLD
jgi:glycolate oxidase